jgi:enolase-phosphatase E1
MKAVLLDIEGTTTPIDFVHSTLFPFSKAKLGEFVNGNLSEIETEIAQLKSEYKTDFTNQIYGRHLDETEPETIVNYLEFLIESDRKSTPLKSLQGKIWQKGYQSGELKSEVFDDVPEAFERWKSEDYLIAIYSSGSVLAQKLLFENTNHGDLTKFISDYFDTTTGAKADAESYKKIAEALELQAEEITFVSDVPSELDAARTAGMQTILSVREGNAPITEDTNHRIVQSFEEIL